MIVPMTDYGQRERADGDKAHRPRVLLIHQRLHPPGGDTAVTAWILEALKDDYALCVLTWDRADLAALDRFYGTSLAGSNISWIYPNRLVQAFLSLDPDPA